MDQTLLVLYLPNRPDISDYKNKRFLKNVCIGRIPQIIDETGNHWRKIFSIYSKIAYSLNIEAADKWQTYRDEILLTKNSSEIICFSSSLLKIDEKTVHIISGKDCASKFDFDLKKFRQVDAEGKILNYKNIYLTPYFDYRQFPNKLVELLSNSIRKVA